MTFLMMRSNSNQRGVRHARFINAANMSAVWKHFKVSENDAKMAVCRYCSANASRGGTTAKSYSTTSLIYHLKSRRRTACRKQERYGGSSSSKKESSFSQSQHTHSICGWHLWKDKKVCQRQCQSKRHYYKDNGIHRLSDMCLPEMYNVISTHIHELLATDIAALSFTTDIWSSDVSPTSMPSLTAQWINRFQATKGCASLTRV